MGRERELKLSAPPGFRLPDLEEAGLRAEPESEKKLVTTYFDTPDLRLARWGVNLRYRVGEGWTVKLPAGGDGGVMVRDEVQFDGPAARVPARAAGLLRAMLRRDEPVAVVRLRTRRRRAAVTDLEGHRLAEFDDDEVSVVEGRRLAARFRQLEVELAEEAPGDVLDRVATALRIAGAVPDPVPKVVRALGPRAEGRPEVDAPAVDGRSPAGDVVTAAIAHSAARLIRNDPGVRLGDDPEAVHQARVATRRLRADLRTFADLVEPEWARAVTTELRWVGGELGDVRDAEVLRGMLVQMARRLPAADHAAALRVCEGLERTREDARTRLLAGLNSERYLDLLDALVAASGAPALTAASEARAQDALSALVLAAWKRLRRAVRNLAAEPPDEDLHRVRILAKRLRYAAEAATLAVAGFDRLAKSAAGLQDVLGSNQDAVVAQGWLVARRPELGGATAFAAGMLWGQAAVQAAQARAAWPKAWKQVRREAARAW